MGQALGGVGVGEGTGSREEAPPPAADAILSSPLWGAPAGGAPPPALPEPAADPVQAALALDGKQEGWAAKPAVENNPDAGQPRRPPLRSLLLQDDGPTLFGTTVTRTAETCLRAFWWRYIAGFELPHEPERVYDGKVRFHPLDLGALVHACMKDYLCAGFDPTMGHRPLATVKPHYPALAAETARLFNRYVDRFREEDERTWDVRAVELEMRYWFPPRKVAGAKRQMVVTSRCDALLRILQPGQERLPLGEPSPDLLDLHDLKTIDRVSSAPAGFRHELQVLQETLCAAKGYWITPDGQIGGAVAETYGKVRGFIVSWIGKAVTTFDPRAHTGRAPYVVEPWMVDEFEQTLGDWLYNEIGERLFGPHRDKPETWPKCYAPCRDPRTKTTCDYISLCEAQNPNPQFTFLRREPMNPEALAPPKKRSRRKAKQAGPAEGENK